MTQRIIAGTINANGSVKFGTGFTATRSSEGFYLISFRPGFESVSGASATQIYNNGNTRDNAVIQSLNNTELYLKLGNGDGNPSDRDFSFIAAGEGSSAAK
ncbi:hypothetical protein [Agrobacterium larrymoorei]|uniref:Uncharacterized protein n=1 Tax=Agrobacterium larrymoorei TaxID=160699 RepID=A0A4D7DVD8_9HYPH|nr:hypothetical protein [Agrobacterium larrymoorei]QCI98172.1 hypothetical protein CFBP5473_09795 [Agrobacterium larrymoorei]QYA06373.1 hypothetical protein J5285_09915 [Agrobacterium larrymoorei]